MPSYLSLLNWTDQGIKDVKDSPKRLDAAKEAITAAGGRLIFFYLLMGEYDIATLIEFPNDEAMANFALTTGARGAIRTTTMKAFTEAEYRGLIDAMK